MKKLFFFLIIISNAAFADWTFVGKNTSGQFFYADFSTLKISGSSRKVWILMNNSKPNERFLSSTSYELIDCNDSASQILQWNFYNKEWAKDFRIASNSTEPKEYHVPGSVMFDVIKNICSK